MKNNELVVKIRAMLGTLEKAPQLDIFREPLKHLVREEDELVKLSGKVEWDGIVTLLSIHYSPDRGRKAIPIRKLAGILILKEIFGGSDESILHRWTENLSFQYFCGEVYPQNHPPASRYDLVKFRARIGSKGLDVIFYPELMNHIEELKESLEAEQSREHSAWNFTNFLRQLFPAIGRSGL